MKVETCEELKKELESFAKQMKDGSKASVYVHCDHGSVSRVELYSCISLPSATSAHTINTPKRLGIPDVAEILDGIIGEKSKATYMYDMEEVPHPDDDPDDYTHSVNEYELMVYFIHKKDDCVNLNKESYAKLIEHPKSITCGHFHFCDVGEQQMQRCTTCQVEELMNAKHEKRNRENGLWISSSNEEPYDFKTLNNMTGEEYRDHIHEKAVKKAKKRSKKTESILSQATEEEKQAMMTGVLNSLHDTLKLMEEARNGEDIFN